MIATLRFHWISGRVRFAERLFIAAMNAAPGKLKNRIALHRMGELTALDGPLRHREVPAITVQELMEAMKRLEAAG